MSPKFPAALRFLNLLEATSLFGEYLTFFSYGFKNIEHLSTLINSNTASREPLITFIALMVSPSTNWRAWPWQCHMDSISFMHAATPVLAASMLDASSGPNLDLLCVQQSGAAPFCENYAKLYFDVKHLEKGLNRSWYNFWLPFFQKQNKTKQNKTENKKNSHLGQYWKLPKFSR